jgi:hypothetical protein
LQETIRDHGQRQRYADLAQLVSRDQVPGEPPAKQEHVAPVPVMSEESALHTWFAARVVRPCAVARQHAR